MLKKIVNANNVIYAIGNIYYGLSVFVTLLVFSTKISFTAQFEYSELSSVMSAITFFSFLRLNQKALEIGLSQSLFNSIFSVYSLSMIICSLVIIGVDREYFFRGIIIYLCLSFMDFYVTMNSINSTLNKIGYSKILFGTVFFMLAAISESINLLNIWTISSLSMFFFMILSLDRALFNEYLRKFSFDLSKIERRYIINSVTLFMYAFIPYAELAYFEKNIGMELAAVYGYNRQIIFYVAAILTPLTANIVYVIYGKYFPLRYVVMIGVASHLIYWIILYSLSEYLIDVRWLVLRDYWPYFVFSSFVLYILTSMNMFFYSSGKVSWYNAFLLIHILLRLTALYLSKGVMGDFLNICACIEALFLLGFVFKNSRH